MFNDLIYKIKSVRKNPIKNKSNGRKNGKYKAWRKAVYKRDGYRCRICGSTGYLNAHHILGYTKWKTKRYDINNGFTMCSICHKKFHKKYGKSNFPNIKELIAEGRLDI